MTNEERFIASCRSVGEADVRQKLNAERYSGPKAVWAASWLEEVESAKSDATRAEEKTTRMVKTSPKPVSAIAVAAILLILLAAGVIAFLRFS